ncbi:hypothetical protein GCM10011571_07900 [Marinithermofilum abyssi]|uniref:Uncharacterized protein n=1 Tax=Marinithermofilum abyssi TaxID=1571185 RepID=A0A8J2VDE5_9BACL|nr:hypothetical protein [Marinithermofilum abyssi]GGE08987.1 hypothetical protein GCM10011571_07900 [Marinithermofilum abyssi]
MMEKWEPQIVFGLFIGVGLLFSISGAFLIEWCIEKWKSRKPSVSSKIVCQPAKEQEKSSESR